MRLTQALLFASVALAFGCDAVLKSPDAHYDDIHFAAYLKSSTPQVGARFGNNLAMDDKTLVVSAPAETVESSGGETVEQAGAFYVYDLSKRDLAPLRVTMPYPHATDGTFPETRWPPHDLSNPLWEVSVPVLSHDWIAVGLPGEEGALAPSDDVSMQEAEADDGASDAGAVHLYRRSDLNALPYYIKAPNAGEGDLFGYALSMSGDWLAVGASTERVDLSSRSSRVFRGRRPVRPRSSLRNLENADEDDHELRGTITETRTRTRTRTTYEPITRTTTTWGRPRPAGTECKRRRLSVR